MRRTDQHELSPGGDRRASERGSYLFAFAFALASATACSSDVSGGGTGGGGAGGAEGGSAGAAGAGAGGGEVDPVEHCAALTTEESCQGFPDPADTSVYCGWWTIETLPDMQTCGPGSLSERCLAKFGGGQGSCTTFDCPAEPAENEYFFRELPDGSVELIHQAGGGCNMITPPFGFSTCSMKPTDPEACLCRCEL